MLWALAASFVLSVVAFVSAITMPLSPLRRNGLALLGGLALVPLAAAEMVGGVIVDLDIWALNALAMFVGGAIGVAAAFWPKAMSWWMRVIVSVECIVVSALGLLFLWGPSTLV